MSVAATTIKLLIGHALQAQRMVDGKRADDSEASPAPDEVHYRDTIHFRRPTAAPDIMQACFYTVGTSNGCCRCVFDSFQASTTPDSEYEGGACGAPVAMADQPALTSSLRLLVDVARQLKCVCHDIVIPLMVSQPYSYSGTCRNRWRTHTHPPCSRVVVLLGGPCFTDGIGSARVLLTWSPLSYVSR